MLTILKQGKTKIFLDHGYGNIGIKRMVSLINSGKLGYMDQEDLCERAWKAGARQRLEKGKYKWYVKRKVKQA